MSTLTTQTILIVSPQSWDHIHISKHHYALELARRGNAVYFLEPPEKLGSGAVSISEVREHSAIRLVRYRPFFPLSIRFHARPIFDALMRRQARTIANALGRAIDILWSFEPNLFSDLRAFGAGLTVYHPVDALIYPHQINVASSADIAFSVSHRVLRQIETIGTPAHFINHGLAEPFATLAREAPPCISESRDRPRKVGYAGNLMHPPLDRPIVRRIVTANPEVQFHFWGPYASSSNTSQATVEEMFVEFLGNQRNVMLHGQVSSAVLANMIQKMDCFLLSYSNDQPTFDGSNSHKILEYLSTGKAIVSSRLAAYSEHESLIRMPQGPRDSELPALFADTLSRLSELNSPELQDKRRRLALDNTYDRQVERIAQLLVQDRVFDKRDRREAIDNSLQSRP